MEKASYSIAIISILINTTFSFELHILHTNDIHAHFEMFSKNSKSCKLQDEKSTDKATICYGGVARRSGYIKKYRERNKNVLLLDAGDMFQGTLWFTVFKGNLSRYFIDYMKYDAMALGSHEFDNDVEGLDPLLIDPTTKIVCSNLVKDSSSTSLMNDSIHSHVILEKGNRSIGIIGYLTPQAMGLMSSVINLTDEILSIEREVQKLHLKGVNIIIALGHSGYQKDIQIASTIFGIDVIVGGHSQSYLGELPDEETDGEYPTVFHHSSNRKTLVVQAGEHGKYIGEIKIIFDSEGKIKSYSGGPILMDKNVPVDQDAANKLDNSGSELKRHHQVILGSTSVNLDIQDKVCRLKECTMGNVYTDAIIFVIRRSLKWPNFTLAIANSGGLRDSIPKGHITLGHLLAVFPFSSKIIMTTLRGSAIWSAFEHSVTSFNLIKPHGKFLQVSGFKVKYNMEKFDGSKVVSLVGKRCYQCPQYDPIDKDKMYEVGVPTFINKGGDGYNMLKTTHIRSFDLLDTDLMITYLKHNSPINARTEGRITGMETYPGWYEQFGQMSTFSFNRWLTAMLYFLSIGFLSLNV